MMKLLILIVLFTLNRHECSEVCRKLPDRNLTVYVKWPYKLSCLKLFKNFSKLSKCYISSGQQIYNKSFVVDLRKIPDKPIQYNLTKTTGVSFCEKLTVLIQPQLISHLSIREDILHSRKIQSDKYFYLPSYHKNLGTINCIHVSSSFYYPVGNWTSSWYYTKFLRNFTLSQTTDLLINDIENNDFSESEPTLLKVVYRIKQTYFVV